MTEIDKVRYSKKIKYFSQVNVSVIVIIWLLLSVSYWPKSHKAAFVKKSDRFYWSGKYSLFRWSESPEVLDDSKWRDRLSSAWHQTPSESKEFKIEIFEKMNTNKNFKHWIFVVEIVINVCNSNFQSNCNVNLDTLTNTTLHAVLSIRLDVIAML